MRERLVELIRREIDHQKLLSARLIFKMNALEDRP